MSTLLVDQLKAGVVFTQRIRVRRAVNLAHIRPHIIKVGSPDGTLVCDVRLGGHTVASSTVDLSDLSHLDTYAHGFIRFDFNNLPLSALGGLTEYELDFYISGHTNSDTNWLGICRDWDLTLYTRYGSVLEGQAINSCIEAIGLNLHELRGV